MSGKRRHGRLNIAKWMRGSIEQIKRDSRWKEKIGARCCTGGRSSFLMTAKENMNFAGLGWIPRRVVSAYDVVNASYLPTTINIYDLEIRSINNYRKSYDIAGLLVSTKISRRCRFGNSKPCKYIRSCIYDNNRVSANISSYDYR